MIARSTEPSQRPSAATICAFTAAASNPPTFDVVNSPIGNLPLSNRQNASSALPLFLCLPATNMARAIQYAEVLDQSAPTCLTAIDCEGGMASGTPTVPARTGARICQGSTLAPPPSRSPASLCQAIARTPFRLTPIKRTHTSSAPESGATPMNQRESNTSSHRLGVLLPEKPDHVDERTPCADRRKLAGVANQYCPWRLDGSITSRVAARWSTVSIEASSITTVAKPFSRPGALVTKYAPV